MLSASAAALGCENKLWCKSHRLCGVLVHWFAFQPCVCIWEWLGEALVQEGFQKNLVEGHE
jgi:hypothetical protein